MISTLISRSSFILLFFCTPVYSNEIFINQIGDNLNLTIVQTGENNQIKGTGTNTSAQVSGNNNNLNINQGVAGNNLLELNVNGNNNDIVVGQEKAYATTSLGPGWSDDTNSYGNHYARADVTGDYNDVQIIQRNNNTSSAGHASYVTINGGNNNSITTLQTGTGSSNGHHSAVRVNSNDSGNTVDIFQNSDTADHRLEVSIYSDNNNLDINQTGTTGNQAYVLFPHNNAGPVNFTLNQSGGDTYGNIDTGSYAAISCGNAAGCSIVVNQ